MVSDLNLSQEPRSLLEFFHEKHDALLGGHLGPELTLEVEVKLYDNFILHLECEMIVSKEEEILSEKWHWSTQKALDSLRKVKELKASLQEMKRELDTARDEIHQLLQMIQSRQNVVNFPRSRLEEMQ